MRCPANKRGSRVVVFRPAVESWPDSGVYQLVVRVAANTNVRIGRLGRRRFPVGTYVYTGRAARGLRARVARYSRGSGVRHWHIDYLLANRNAQIVEVRLASPQPGDECRVNRATGCDAICGVPRFGSSDCRGECGTHLWRVK
jgi:Uri superfamily endonuclease